MNEPIDQINDKDFGFCKILFNTQAILEKVCLFAAYTFSPILPEYTYYYLDEIKKSGISIVFISSSKVSDLDFKRLSSFSDIIIEKENRGVDFGAWACALRYLNFGSI